jgi:hypothetical protein
MRTFDEFKNLIRNQQTNRFALDKETRFLEGKNSSLIKYVLDCVPQKEK